MDVAHAVLAAPRPEGCSAVAADAVMAVEVEKVLGKLGQLPDDRLAQPDADWATQLMKKRLEVLVAHGNPTSGWGPDASGVQ